MEATAVDRISVLHVDDDPGFADLAAEFLEREDDRFVVETARSADRGLEVLSDREVDCVVSDYDMAGRDGIEFLRAVRETCPDLPFILYTGKGSEEIASEAISAGVTDYLQKGAGTDQYAILANRVANAVERTRADRERRRHLEAIESAQEGISVLDEDGRFVFLNDACADIYGYDREELLGESWEILYPDEERAHVRENVLPEVEETGRWSGTTTGLRADGTTFRREHVLTKTDDDELVCTVQEVSEDEDLAEKHELVAKASADAFWDWDPQADVITRNEEYLSGFGYDSGDIGSETDWWRERIHPEDRERVLSAVERALEDPETTYDETYRLRRADGTYGHVRSRGYVIYDEDGTPTRMVGAHIDVTEQREYEREIERRNDRLAEFASIVSHDLRNPLEVASGRITLARDECDSDHLESAASALDRMDALIEDLLTLAREGERAGDLEPVDLRAVAGSCWENVAIGDAELRVDTDRTVRADRGRLQQLIENLLRNAVEHGSTSRTSGTRDDVVEHGGEGVTVTVGDLPDGFYVADDGPGIPEDRRDQVFDRGYSTAEEGTGFGLAIVAEVASAHGWTVSVTESEEGGARFEITGVTVDE